MANAGTQAVPSGVKRPGEIDPATLASILDRVRAQSVADPSSNPILLFALDLTLQIDRGQISLDDEETALHSGPDAVAVEL